jgi:hypothetical protein
MVRSSYFKDESRLPDLQFNGADRNTQRATPLHQTFNLRIIALVFVPWPNMDSFPIAFYSHWLNHIMRLEMTDKRALRSTSCHQRSEFGYPRTPAASLTGFYGMRCYSEQWISSPVIVSLAQRSCMSSIISQCCDESSLSNILYRVKCSLWWVCTTNSLQEVRTGRPDQCKIKQKEPEYLSFNTSFSVCREIRPPKTPHICHAAGTTNYRILHTHVTPTTSSWGRYAPSSCSCVSASPGCEGQVDQRGRRLGTSGIRYSNCVARRLPS